MGFYQPAQIVSDARKHGVEVRPADINHSDWDNRMEGQAGKYRAVRLGFRQIKGIHEEDMTVLCAGRGEGYKGITALMDAGVSEAALERLADADCFRSIGLDRRQALWEVSALKDRPNGMFTGMSAAHASEKQIQLPLMSLSEHVVHDYGSMALSLKAHPVSFVRDKLDKLGVLKTSDLANAKDGDNVKVAGLVLVRQRPGTAGGVCFITIEDDEGENANLVVFEKLFTKYRKEVLNSRLLMVEGKLQIEGEVIHVIVKKCYDLSMLLRGLTEVEADKQPVQTLARADEKDGYPHYPQNKRSQVRKVVQQEIFPSGRNFK
ncbi:MAG TPA: OB-fold nucleic acid binding domain-containing protein, partial [Daejeonella sp.]